MIDARRAPSPMETFAALVRAELAAYVRGARTLIWTVLVPLFILALGEMQVPAALQNAPAPTLEISALAITTGAFALGLFGYANVLANYRERGIFQRLRCSPAPTWQLLGARLLVQLCGVIVQAAIVFAADEIGYRIAPTSPGIWLGIAAILVGGLAALALGQTVVALARSAASVTAISRLLLLVLFLLEGIFVSSSRWPAWLHHVADWTPVRLALRLTTDGLVLQHWGTVDLQYLAGLVAWIAVLGYVGLMRFRWQPE